MDPSLRFWRVVASLLLLGLAGCAAPAVVAKGPTCAPPLPAESTAGVVAVNTVAITDAQLTGRVMIQSTNARRQPTGTVEVWTRLFNCSDAALQLEARTHFLDASQGPTEPVTAWTRVFLPARSYAVYTESSTDIDLVRHYYVEVREGR
jgi:hypothetical protein